MLFAHAHRLFAQDCDSPTFSDDFDVYAHGTLIDSLDDWKATTGGPFAPTIFNQQARIPVRSTQTNAYIRPFCSGCPVQHPLAWQLDLVYREFMRVEFDLKPTFVTTNPTGADGKISLYLAPSENSGANLDSPSTPGPAVALDLVCDDVGGGVVQVAPKLRAKEPAPGMTVFNVTMPTFTLPDFTGSFRKFRLDFGWDWYVNPGKHVGDPMDPDYGKDQRGKPFLFARFMYHDGTTWRNPMVEQSQPTNPRKNPNLMEDDRNFDGTNGWIKFGEDQTYGVDPLGDSFIFKTGCDRRDWEAASTDPDCPRLYPYVLAERIGTADVNWFLDDFTAYPHVPEPVTLFVNTVGYDTAAPQWVLIRPNRTQWRDLDSMTTIKNQITIAELRDSSGAPLRSLAAANLTLSGPDHCFREFDDWETWPFVNSKAIYWLRLDWSPITTAIQDCYLHVEGTTPSPDSQPFAIESHRFDVDEEIWWRAAWPDLLIANELARRGPLWGFPDGGGSDAGNNNAEGRAHGLFVSGVSGVIRNRRAELSTEELRSLVHPGDADTQPGSLRFVADWLVKLADISDPLDDGSDEADERRLEHQFISQGCGAPEADHYLDVADPSQEPIDGHIWEEHYTRPRGQGEDIGDLSNSIDRMSNCAYGLIDAAVALAPFDSAAASEYATQANESRSYFYWLDGEHCSGEPMDKYLAYRAQAAFDFAFEDYSSGLLPNPTNDPGSPPVLTNFALGKRKIEKDLDQFEFDEVPTTDFTPWIGCNHGLTAPQNPPWLGFARLLEREPTGGYSGEMWSDYLSILADRFYAVEVHPSDALNTLHVSRFWTTDTTHQAFRGVVQRPNDKVAYETHSISRLAMALGPTDASYSVLRKLTVGSLNWLMGIHYGVRGRYVLPPSDREWECGAFLPSFGSASVVQNLRAIHYWSEPSLLAGPGGELNQPTPSGGTKGPDLPPWSYSPQVYGNTETFLRRDGSLLMAAECSSRLFHPSRVYEAESAFAVSGAPTLQSNNSDPDHLNGGLSYVGFNVGGWIKLAVDPANGTSAPDPDPVDVERDYRILVRAANPSVAAKTVTVEIFNSGAGTPFFTGSVTVAPTGHTHEYVVLMLPATVQLNNGNVYEIKVVLPGGDVSLDCVELKSLGL